jgi:hypothetical protein
LFEIVERRREALRNYLEWAKANDNEQSIAWRWPSRKNATFRILHRSLPNAETVARAVVATQNGDGGVAGALWITAATTMTRNAGEAADPGTTSASANTAMVARPPKRLTEATPITEVCIS